MSAYGCFADVYDTLTSNIDYKELAGYYDRIITSHGGKRGILLDLACGTGSTVSYTHLTLPTQSRV